MGASKCKGGSEDGENMWESKTLCEERTLISVGRDAICESLRCLNSEASHTDTHTHIRTHSEALTQVHT